MVTFGKLTDQYFAMCLIFISLKDNPNYKLIVAANRDEFYSRKTAPVHFWKDHPHVLAGRDLEAMGTWMGVNKKGNVSMVTNYRDMKNILPNAPSRGQLVSDYLIYQHEPQEYMKNVAAKGNKYNGFNLIVGTPEELVYYSNYKQGIEHIAPGVHGLSNHLLDTPWPKVRDGMKIVGPLMRSETVNAEALLDALYNAEPAADSELPDTGVGIERERLVSSMFIKGPTFGYGSRCSTVLMIDRDDQVFFRERVYDTATFTHTTQSFKFAIDQ